MYFHKETEEKDTLRRGRYLKQLINTNALGPNKSLLNRVGIPFGEEA
jgi:hypothetical protein